MLSLQVFFTPAWSHAQGNASCNRTAEQMLQQGSLSRPEMPGEQVHGNPVVRQFHRHACSLYIAGILR